MSQAERERKFKRLLNHLKRLGNAAVAFSGGVDSTFLLVAAKKALNDRVIAFTVKTPYIPDWELEEALVFCKKEGISEAAYYYWRRKLTGRVSASEEKSTSKFLEVVVPKIDSTVLELIFSSGSSLRINPGVDHKMLNQVLSALKQAGLC